MSVVVTLNSIIVSNREFLLLNSQRKKIASRIKAPSVELPVQ